MNSLMKLINILVIVLLLNSSSVVEAQENDWKPCSRDKVVSELTQYNNSVRKTECSSYAVTYNSFTGNSSSDSYESIHTTVSRYKQNYIVSMDDVTTLYTGTNCIIIDSIENRIVLSKQPSGTFSPIDQLDMINKLVEKAVEVKYRKLDNGLACYAVISDETSDISELRAGFNKNGFCEFVELYFNKSSSSRLSEDLGYNITKLEILFSNYNFKCNDDSDVFQEKNYFIKSNDKLIATSKYSSFQLIDTRIQ